MTRHRLTAAQRRHIDEMILPRLMSETRPFTDAISECVIDAVLVLPAELRYEGLRRFMNEWATQFEVQTHAGLTAVD